MYKNNIFTKYLCSRVVRIHKPSTFHPKSSQQALLSPNTSALFRRLKNVCQISKFFILYLLKYGFLEISLWWISFSFHIVVIIWHFVLLRCVAFLKKSNFMLVNTCDYRGFISCVTGGFNSKFSKEVMCPDETI